MNENDAKFNLEYLRFEVKYFDKLMARREVLNHGKLDFVDNSEEIEGETKRGDEANIVNIVWQNLKKKYSEDVVVLREAKIILKESKYLSQNFTGIISDAREIVRSLKLTQKG